ncbi:alpha beta-hydrolase [Diplodia corticola]|uniref:Alpha beta-hydrolase n=1 Tax=Diplodia corticola TaxID=236234 RepID=A0A1J9R8H2_9PEZI|nr:alpha beta-hydrolase [Diplodia corticola]OJD36825.1 alpha beta-hydrolase [Diplodia corticola]
MLPFNPLIKKAYFGLAGAGALYAALMLCLTNVTIQRNALYANKIVGAWWADVDKPQAYGFAKNQVTAFNLTTLDNELLYAWHVLPLNVYEKHESELLEQPSGSPDGDFTQTKAFELLANDPDARLVINFHGNAGHVAQGWRTDTYRALTSQPNTHLVTVDYRGFGRSTGTPTEAGLIADGVALATYALETLRIPSSRIVIVGQSLGTAVASAVGLHFADPSASLSLLPNGTASTASPPHAALSHHYQQHNPRVDFAAILLIAPFTSLPTLLETYRIFGLVPVLSPVRGYPRFSNYLRAAIVDTWPTASRIGALVGTVAASDTTTKRTLRLHVIHAKDDFDIPWTHGQALYEAASAAVVNQTSSTAGGEEAKIEDVVVQADGERTARLRRTAMKTKTAGGGGGGGGDYARVDVRMDLVPFGGHNRVVTFAPVALAVRRAFDAAAAAGAA